MKLKSILKESLKHFNEVEQILNSSLQELYETTKQVNKKEFFAPLYVSNVCASSCPYCPFRKGNKIKRITLTYEECLQEVLHLKEKGLSSVYCLTGSWNSGSFNKLNSMTEVNSRGLQAIKEAQLFPILESSPFSERNFKELLEVNNGKGRFVLFQETYNPSIYVSIHKGDKYKGDPDARINQINLAIKAGWQEIGIGSLLGLNQDIKQEIASIVSHYNYLQSRVNKITISVPRINPGKGILLQPAIEDELFQKIVLAIRIMCPEAKIVLTGRENSEMREKLKKFTHIWGIQGSTVPGGYTLGQDIENGQFFLNDKRSIEEIKII